MYPEIHEVIFYHALPDYCGLTRAQLWHNIKIGSFPKPIKVNDNGNRGWLKSEINLWLLQMLGTPKETDK